MNIIKRFDHKLRIRPPSATPASTWSAGRGAHGRGASATFEVNTDRPHKPEQFTRHHHRHFSGGLAPYDESAVAAAQPLLRLPGDRFHLLADALLAPPQGGAALLHARPEVLPPPHAVFSEPP